MRAASGPGLGERVSCHFVGEPFPFLSYSTGHSQMFPPFLGLCIQGLHHQNQWMEGAARPQGWSQNGAGRASSWQAVCISWRLWKGSQSPGPQAAGVGSSSVTRQQPNLLGLLNLI